ncbi:MAG: nucleotide exchange factor GrpE [Chlamydiales bacterium]|nr:nucleotide exchange factor GrpE [Chlamydiales bacterium]
MSENETPKEEKEESSPAPELDKTAQLEAEIKEWKDKHLRTLAEMENSRKRMQKEKQDSVRYAMENLFADLLGPVDNLENALAFTDKMSDETKKWAVGFQMILGQFKELLTANNVQPFESIGMQFDPHKHQAIEMEETEDKPEGVILQEFVKGYRCGDRIIRPARVKVAKKPSSAPAEPN